MRKDIHAYFRSLGLNPGAGPVEIKRAYRQLMQRWHPDLYKAGSPMQTTAEDMAKEINEAYDQLYRKKLYRKFLPKSERNEPAADDAPADGEQTRATASPPPRADRKQRDRRGMRAEAAARARSGGSRAWKAIGRLRWARIGWAVGAAALLGAAVPLYHWVTQPPSEAPVSAPGVTQAESRAEEPASPGPSASPGGAEKGRRAAASERPTSSSARPARRAAGSSIDSSPTLRSLSAGDLASTGDAAATGHLGPAGYPRSHAGPGGSPPRSVENPPAAGTSSSVRAEAGPWDMRVARVQPELGSRLREAELLFQEADSLLNVFETGDTRARVLEIQGKPDEAGENVLRYGSSLVYFKSDRVQAWCDRSPRLHVRIWPSFPVALLDTFTVGSSRAEVVRAQGFPSLYTPRAYFYGTSVVMFDAYSVVRWEEGDVRLRRFSLPTLPFTDLDRLTSR